MDERYFIEVNIEYPQEFYELHNDLPFFPERKIMKVEQFVANLHDEKNKVLT